MTAKLDISQSLYNTDYLQWIEATVENLRDRNYDRIDIVVGFHSAYIRQFTDYAVS